MLELTVGEDVQTLQDGRNIWTKVHNIHKIEGDFEFVTLMTDSQVLKVTPQHPVFVKENGQNLVREAGIVAVGNALVQSDGCTEVVVNITRSYGSTKVIIETEHGSVLAGGIYARCMMSHELFEGKAWMARHIVDPDAFTSVV
jgi:hypothetical protein